MPRIAAVIPFLLALTAVACQSTSSTSNADFDARLRIRGITEAEVGAKLAQYLREFEGKVSWASYQIQYGTTDDEVRQQAMIWRTLLVPASLSAAFQPGPSRGLIDLWALVLQMEQYFAEGDGRDSFGEHQQIALAACADLRGEIEKLEPDLPLEDTAALRSRIEAWVQKNPMTGDGFSRPSTAATVAKILGPQSRSITQAVHSIDERIADLTQRITIYAGSIPRQARWQAEIIAEQMLVRPELSGALRDLSVTADAVTRIAEIDAILAREVTRLEELVAAERLLVLDQVQVHRDHVIEAVRGERETVLSDVDRQRLATLDAVEKQLDGALTRVDGVKDDVLASVRETRAEVLRVIDEEHRRVFADAEQLATRTLDQSMLEARSLVDHIALRAVQGGALLIALLFVAGVLYRRFTR